MQKKNRIKKEIRCRKKLWFLEIFLTTCFLCGCTKKEELLLLTQTAAVEETAAAEAVSQESGDTGGAGGVSNLTGEDASGVQETGASIETSVDRETGKSMICVHVCGAVNAPGVYELPAGSRVFEAVQAAEGFSTDAEQDYVNQAQILADGVKLVIPTQEEAAGANGSVTAQDGGRQNYDAAEQDSGTALQIGIVGGVGAAEEDAKRPEARVNINTATKQELCTIPGVGESRAAAIISYRESHGGFAKPEDIMKVNGIKEGMYDKIKESISVD